MRSKLARLAWMGSIVLMTSVTSAPAEDLVDVNVGVDLVSRYIWRGTDYGNSPSIQPALSVSSHGFELGAWAAYAFSASSSDTDEIDFWAGYQWAAESGAGFGLIVTDYTFPNAGLKFGDSEAHTIEVGASVTGPETFPLTASGYVNVRNDDGNNTYFQLDYPLNAGTVELGFFVGAAGGSAENPGYYGTETFHLINVGVSAMREIEVSGSFSLPLTGWAIYNPLTETAYIVVGVSL